MKINAQTMFSVRITAASGANHSSKVLVLPSIPAFDISINNIAIRDDYVQGSPIGVLTSSTLSGRPLACYVSPDEPLSSFFVVDVSNTLYEYGLGRPADRVLSYHYYARVLQRR